MGELPKAKELAEAYLADYPNDVDGLTEAAGVALDQGHNQAAEGYLRRALKANPNHRQARYHLILVLSRQGKTARGRAEKRPGQDGQGLRSGPEA